MGGGAVVVVLLPVGDNFTIDETGNWLKRVVVVVSIEEFDDTLFETSLVICAFEIVSRESEFPQWTNIKNNRKNFFNTNLLFHTINFSFNS